MFQKHTRLRHLRKTAESLRAEVTGRGALFLCQASHVTVGVVCREEREESVAMGKERQKGKKKKSREGWKKEGKQKKTVREGKEKNRKKGTESINALSNEGRK